MRDAFTLPVSTLIAALVSAAVVVGAQPDQQLPRFRAGANLVRVDAYVSQDGTAVTDLTADDFEVLEDDVPQSLENFELVRARDATASPTLTGPTTAGSTREQAQMASDPAARVFVIYLDMWHVGLDGSYKSSDAIAEMLEKVIGPNDLVGFMTPEMSPQNLTLVRRGQGLPDLLREGWTWGQTDRLQTADPREQDIRGCYPDVGETEGMALEIIARRREQKTLRSLEDAIGYLDALRDERKFVVLLTSGWVLFRSNEGLARTLGNNAPSTRPPIGVGIDGRAATGADPRNGGTSNYDWCERERVMVSYIDHEREVRELAQRANRANVSFYPVDPRGLVPFDAPIGPDKPPPPSVDAARMRNRQDGLRELAHQTDGAVVLNTNDTGSALARILADTGSYYLMSYYSTNQKLDGRFRRITVRVKREGLEVRARPGYLAPTEAEARAAGGGTAGTRPALAPGVSRALDAIVPGRGNLPMRLQASGLSDRVRAVVELDRATLKDPQWQAGASLRITIETDRGGSPIVIEDTLSAGQRSLIIEGPDQPLAPGRYIIRAEALPANGSGSIRASGGATIAASGAAISSAPIALRRGPTTGLAYLPTADPRFRRTERLRLEVPILAEGQVGGTGRVLTREGQPLAIAVGVSVRTDERSGQRYLQADATLAPLAQGDYVLEVAVGSESAVYGFRIVP